MIIFSYDVNILVYTFVFLDVHVYVYRDSKISFRFLLPQVWFQNRRAKWRKREKTLGRESPPSYLSGPHHEHLIPNLSELTGLTMPQQHPHHTSVVNSSSAAAVAAADLLKIHAQAFHSLQLNSFLPPMAHLQHKSSPIHPGHPFQALFHPYILPPTFPLLSSHASVVFPQTVVTSPAGSPDVVCSPSSSPPIGMPISTTTSPFNTSTSSNTIISTSEATSSHLNLQSTMLSPLIIPSVITSLPSALDVMTSCSGSGSSLNHQQNSSPLQLMTDVRGHSAELLRLKARQHQAFLEQLSTNMANSGAIIRRNEPTLTVTSSK